MNTTFTTYAEKKAKQFLNLLQGYTKGIRLTAILILLLLGVNNAWAVERIYLKLNTWKTSDGGRYAAYLFNDNDKKYWQNMYETSIANVLACDIPADGITYNKVIFVRLNPSGSDSENGGNNWNNKWNQSGDITLQKNQLFTADANWDSWKGSWSTITWYITGSFNGWVTNNSATSYTLNANTTYEFKVYSPKVGYFSNTGTMERGNHSNWDMYANVGDCKLTTDIAGTYIFTYNGDKMNVTYPEDCYLPGTFNGWAENAASSLKSGSVTLNLAANTTYTFKIHNFGATSASWHGNTGTMTRAICTNWEMKEDADCKITTDFAGNYIFTYDRSTQKLSVTYPTAYKVTYDIGTNRGTTSVTTNLDIPSGSLALPSTSITFSKGATIEGYTWKGWYSKTDGTGTKWGDGTTYTSTNRTGDISVYACYDLITYNITYNLNGGTGATNTTYNVESAAITLPTTPTKTGYTFAGWYDNANLTGNEVTQIAKGSTGDKAFYAKWTPNTYNITYDNLKGAIHSNPATYTIESTTITFTAPTSKPVGYTFVNWSPASITAGSTGDVTVTANWTAATSEVELNQEEATEKGTASVIATYGSAMPAITKPSRTGYTFAGYYTEKNGGGTQYYNANGSSATTWALEGDQTLYAKWEIINYTITYHLNGGSGATNTTYTIESADITLPINMTKTGYTFAGWYDNSTFSGSPVTTIAAGSTGNKTFYAKWTANTYTVVYDKNGGAGEQIVDQEFIYDEDGTLSTSTYERNGYTFDGWNTNANGTGKNYDGGATVRNLATSGTITLYAKWTAIQYTITYTGLQGATHSNPETYTIEDAITFAAPSERNGYVFAGWQPASIAVGTTGNITVTAKWTEKEANTIYLKPSDGWKTYNARFAVYCWDSVNTENNRWIDMNSVDETKEYYVANIPVEFDRCNFVRLNPDFDENRWNNWTDGVEEDPKPVWEQTHDLTIPAGNHHLYDMTTNTHLYLKVSSEWKTDGARFAAHFFVKNGGNDKIHWMSMFDLGDDVFYCQIPTENKYDYVNFCRMKPDDLWNGWDQRWSKTTDLKIPTNGDNIFTINGWDVGSTWGKREDNVWDNSKWTCYTFSHKQGDYRLVYVDDTNGAHPGHLITKQAEGTIKDTVSFFVYNQGDARVLLQQCTNANGGDPTWETISTCYVFETGSANPNTSMIQGKRNTSDLHVGAGCGVEESGVYNFVLQQTDGTATILANETHKYTGEFYIRTDVSDGGWNCFKQASNKMTYSSYAEKNTNFTHYFCKWIKANRSVRYTIANDYSYCISDTLVGDVIIEKDGCAPGYLPENGNVRFAWNCNTNELSRAYIRGSGNVSDRFLVLIGNEHLKDENGEAFLAGGDGRDGLGANETIFRDLHNWVYQVDVTANNQTTIQLSAEYNEQDQFFIGRSINGGGRSLLSASNSESYKVRMIYDFKVNNLLAAWVLDQKDTINTDTLTTNMLIIRKDQEQANQINFANGRNAALYTAYAVMTFTKTHVSDATKSNFNRYEYWVSFPFDVKISDVFGFGEYGDKWILKLYDGAGRAKNGLWVDSDSYWKYITNRNYTLKAGRGFILQLDKNSMTEDDAFKHGAAEVSLYFPSTPNQNGYTIINAEPTTINVPSHECTIERDNRNIYDSHWNLIGVPGFADLENLNVESLKRKVTIENQPHNLAFYYAYNAEENSYDPSVTSATFKNMYAYMVQYAGEINWTSFPTVPQQLAARRNSNSNKPEKLTLRLEIAQGEKIADQTFVQLQQEGATPEFDMNLDLTKIINSGANIYTLVGNSRIQSAGNAMPMSECVVPVGVKIDAEGEYTFRMPEGTEGMVVELVDYETYNRTNLLLTDYTVTLPKGTSENRFALHIQPQKDVVTSLENIGEGVNNGETVNKYLIDGKLIIRTADGMLYDAQGKRL